MWGGKNKLRIVEERIIFFSHPWELNRLLQWVFVLQILYANEGECRKEADMETVPQGDKTNCLPHKGHEFIPTLYHFPSNCEACSKPLWHVFKPPPALECRRCHVKCHKDHLDKKEDVIAPCKGNAHCMGVILLLPQHTGMMFNGDVLLSCLKHIKWIINSPYIYI